MASPFVARVFVGAWLFEFPCDAIIIFLPRFLPRLGHQVNTAGIISLVVWGPTYGGYGGDGGPASATSITSPYGVAVSPNGDLFFSDTKNNIIRKVIRIGASHLITTPSRSLT